MPKRCDLQDLLLWISYSHANRSIHHKRSCGYWSNQLFQPPSLTSGVHHTLWPRVMKRRRKYVFEGRHAEFRAAKSPRHGPLIPYTSVNELCLVCLAFWIDCGGIHLMGAYNRRLAGGGKWNGERCAKNVRSTTRFTPKPSLAYISSMLLKNVFWSAVSLEDTISIVRQRRSPFLSFTRFCVRRWPEKRFPPKFFSFSRRFSLLFQFSKTPSRGTEPCAAVTSEKAAAAA